MTDSVFEAGFRQGRANADAELESLRAELATQREANQRLEHERGAWKDAFNAYAGLWGQVLGHLDFMQQHEPEFVRGKLIELIHERRRRAFAALSRLRLDATTPQTSDTRRQNAQDALQATSVIDDRPQGT